MKKWFNTILLALSCAALAATARWWVPKLLPLLGLVFKNKETVGTFKDFVQTVGGIMALAVPFLKAWTDRKEKEKGTTTAPGVTNSPAARDINVAGGDIQTGGTSLATQGKVSIAGHVAGRDINIYESSVRHVLPSLFQLPPPPADFTGRETELHDLRAAMEICGAHISGLQGQGGVGKTALALKLAAELAPNFPDAQIYINLKGVSEKPLTAAEAMSHVLRTFHPEAKLPEKEEELRPQYLSVLHNKRALLLMDNAKDAAQVKPLTPPPGCALLVTSRQHFALPGLQAKNLETLPPSDAKDLLLRIAPRIAGEAEDIAKLCGYLPQALRLAASAIAVRVNLEPRDYATQLADEKKRLELLAGNDESMNASITLSYNLLDAETQERWRMLAVFPDTFDASAAAAVWAIKTDAAKDILSRLLQFSVLEWNDATKRYRLHDLMRDFARERLTVPGTRDAAIRHARHFGVVLASADVLYRKGGDSTMSGLARFDLEWENIQAGLAWAAAHAVEDREAAKLCTDYPDWGTSVFSLRQHPREEIRWRKTALAAARQLEDRAAEGRHLGNLGVALAALGEYSSAIEHHERHRLIAQEIGDRKGEGQAVGNLGVAYKNLGEFHRAIEHHNQRLDIARAIRDRRGEGAAIGNLGIVYGSLGDYRRAVEYGEAALALGREIGDRRDEGRALGNLGNIYFELGDHHRAIEYQHQHLALAREIRDRRGEANALGGLGVAYGGLSDYRSAIEYHGQHLAIAREIGHRHGEGNALGNLGFAYSKLGEHRCAIDCYEQQLTIAREIGDRQGHGIGLFSKSGALYELGDRKKAIEQAEAALKILEQIEDPNAAMVRKQLDIWRNR